MKILPFLNAALIALSVIASGAVQTVRAQEGAGITAMDSTLEDLGVNYPIRLKTTFGQASVIVNIPSDRIATKAEVELRYAHSPSLRWDQSHLGVFVNSEAVKLIRLDEASSAGTTATFEINPLLLLGRNELRFDFVGHYAPDGTCEDPANTTLWADISNTSRIKIEVAPVDLPLNLASLPSPWFDTNSNDRLELPFVFTRPADAETVKAAGMVAAWFGAKADYRGAEFTATNQVPASGHAIVFETGSSGFGRVSGTPEIRVVRNPSDRYGRLLVFSAPDNNGLIKLAQGFVMGAATMNGPVATVPQLDLPPVQGAWESPLWVHVHQHEIPLQPFLLGPSSVRGLNPGPVQYEFLLPPDMYVLGKRAGRLNMLYRASRSTGARSALNIDINGQYIGSEMINREGSANPTGAQLLRVDLPPELLTAKNRLNAQFFFPRDTSKACEDFRADSLQGSLDPESTLELGRHYHYAEMPALNGFADGGFPFSKFGDLSQTAVVIPDSADTSDLSAALTALGHIGRWTHAPAIHLDVVTHTDVDRVMDRDLLVIRPARADTLPADFFADSPLYLGPDGADLRTASAFGAIQSVIEGRQLREAESYASRVLVEAGNALGAISEFESPLSGGRTVVALMSGDAFDIARTAKALVDPGQAQFIHGGLALIAEDSVSAYDLGSRYSVGSLPLWYAAIRWLSLHPYMLLPLLAVLALIAALLIRGALRRRARKRLSGEA